MAARSLLQQATAATLRMLLRLYPASFRRRFADAALDMAMDDVAAAAREGRVAALRAAATAAADALAGIIPEHLAAHRAARHRQRPILEDVVREDLRYALRQLRRAPAFTCAAVLLVGLGTGANTAVFSLVRSVLLRPLPYHDPDRVAMLWKDGAGRPGGHARHGVFTGAHVREMRGSLPAADDLAALESWQGGLAPLMDFVGPDGAERLRGVFATPNFFRVLGVEAALGRGFVDSDSEANPVVVLSDAFWRRRFGADPAIIGRTVTLAAGSGNRRGQRAYTIAGVLPPEFKYTYPEETEVWTVLPWSTISPERALRYQVVARLKRGATLSELSAQSTEADRTIIRTYGMPPASAELALGRALVTAETATEHVLADARSGVWLIAAVAALVLLIACVNLALLLLARTVDRRRELAVRASVGAAPRRLLRQLAVEGMVIAALGSAAGLAMAWLTLPLLRAFVPAAVPRGVDASIDGQVLAFSLLLCAVTGIVCGVIPGLQALRIDLQAPLRAGATISADRGVTRTRRIIVALQAGVVVLLLVASGLLLHSFWRMQRIDLGFQAEGVVTMEMRLLNVKYRSAAGREAFQSEILASVRALPAVIDAGLTTAVPMRGVDFLRQIERPGGVRAMGHERVVDPGYFRVMNIPLNAGRLFTDQDTAASERVAILSESHARRLFGDENPIGQQVIGSRPATVVGIVGDLRYADVTKEPAAAYYVPAAQQPSELVCLVARTRPGVTGVAAAIRRAIQDVDPEQPVEKLTTIEQIVAGATADQRFYTAATSVFSVVALLLAVSGVFSVASRSVTERTREIAIRMALGADARRLARLVLAHGFRPVAIGIAAGLVASFAFSRLLSKFLFEVRPADPAAFGGAALLVAIMALAGCYWPARRATRTDPIAALKAE